MKTRQTNQLIAVKVIEVEQLSYFESFHTNFLFFWDNEKDGLHKVYTPELALYVDGHKL